MKNSRHYLHFAGLTNKSFLIKKWLEFGMFSILHAVVTKIMNWLIICSDFFQFIYKHSRFKLMKGISLRISYETIMFGNFLFHIGNSIEKHLLFLKASK